MCVSTSGPSEGRTTAHTSLTRPLTDNRVLWAEANSGLAVRFPSWPKTKASWQRAAGPCFSLAPAHGPDRQGLVPSHLTDVKSPKVRCPGVVPHWRNRKETQAGFLEAAGGHTESVWLGRWEAGFPVESGFLGPASSSTGEI